MSDLEWLAAQYPMVRPLGDHYAILRPLTFGRWRLSRCDRHSMLDGY